MNVLRSIVRAVAPLVAASALGAAPAGAAEQLDFVLNWKPGGDHAPIYWARKEGWYEQAGIDLNIIEGSGSGASAKKVGVGQVPIGIMDLPTGLQNRGKGADLVAVMTIYANSPYGIYWKKSSGINDYQDLRGRKIGNPPFDAARQMWPAIAKVLGFDPDEVAFVNVKPNAKVAALKSDAIDATTSFYNIHHIFQRIFGDDMGFVALRDLGFNPYGNSIVANGKYLAEHPETVRAFVQVTQRAYAACLADAEPCVEVLAKAGSQKVDDVRTNWELVVELMDAQSARSGGLGYFDPERMQADYAAVDASFDIESYDVTDFYSNDFIDPSIKFEE